MAQVIETLTEQHLEAMAVVKNGADVYDYGLAVDLREVQRHDPGLIEITRPKMYTGDGTDHMPYFGAILTERGLAELEKRL